MNNVCVDLKWFGEYVEYFLLTLFLLLLGKLAYDYFTRARREGMFMTSPARSKFLKEFISDGLVDHINSGLKTARIDKEEHGKLIRYVRDFLVDRDMLPKEKITREKLGDVSLLSAIFKHKEQQS